MGLFQFCSPRTIKNIDRPNKFYIYRSLDKMEHIKNYLDGLCHISYSEFFNDPFDTSFAEQFSVSWFSKYPALRMFDIVMRYLFIGDRRKEILKEKFAQVVDTNKELSFKEVFAIINSLLPYNERYDIEEACASIEKYINERNPVFSMPYKVACFGSRYDSILMWAYYGGAHKGICIEYDFSLINQSDDLNKNIATQIYPVNYTNKRPHEDASTRSDTYYTKGSEWKHEEEWRIVCATDVEFLPLSCISAIYLGALYTYNSECIKSQLCRWLIPFNHKIKFYEMIPDKKKYILKANKISLDKVLKK